MSIERVGSSGVRTLRGAGCLAAALMVLFGSGCSQIIKAVTGWDVPFEGENGVGEPPKTVYLQGPVPGWEVEVLRTTPYGIPPSLFEVDLFAGQCPGLNLAARSDNGPFASPLLAADFMLFDLVPSYAADVNYYQPGRVTLVGLTDPFSTSAFARMQAFGGGGGCASVGIPLVSFGNPVIYTMHR